MNKYKLFFILIILLLFSGCVRNNTNVIINKDKSMTYEIEILLSSKISNNYSKTISSKVKEYEEKGFSVTVSTEKDNNGGNIYLGEKISKNYENIDDLSSIQIERVNIFDILEKDVKLFKKENGFFKDKYTASFEFEINEEDYKLNEENETNTDTTTEENIEIDEETIFKYSVTLPYECISNNAHEINNDGKELVWELNSSGKQDIDYSFNIYNMSHLIIVYSILIVIDIVLVVLIIIVIKKNKKA